MYNNVIDPRCYPTTVSIQKNLDENQVLLVKAFEAQNTNHFDLALEYLEKISETLIPLGQFADEQPNLHNAIQATSELLGSEQLAEFSYQYPIEMQRYLNGSKEAPTPRQSKRLSKQVKHKWTPEEQKKFIKALHLYGKKEAEKIAKYLGTRTISQVRSHIQKHFLKLKKTNIIGPEVSNSGRASPTFGDNQN